MSDVRPFRGLRPATKFAEQVAAPPYDVLNSQEARELAAGNPYSFLYINKPEIGLAADIDPYDESVYKQGADQLRKLMSDGVIGQDDTPCYYVYRQIMGDHHQVGIVAAASVQEYEDGLIKKHEFTRPVKEDDRVKHIDYQNAQVGPVFLTYRRSEKINALVDTAMAAEPVYNFAAADGIQHTFWVVAEADSVANIQAAFSEIEALYVADGHHRSAAALRVRNMRRDGNPQHSGDEPYNFFLTVIFPDDQMQILDYNRVVKDLNGQDANALLAAIESKFSVSPVGDITSAKPAERHHFAMYLEKQWYSLTIKEALVDENDPVRRLDVSLLQEHLLAPMLAIGDPRKDNRIDFVGGIRGLQELERRVDSGDCAVAFALYPTSIAELLAIADAGEVMPPKSTWFEPKLRSGLIVHLLDE